MSRRTCILYIGGIVRAEKGVLYDIGGIEDHVHLYLAAGGLMNRFLEPYAYSEARSSLWVHNTFLNLGD